MAYFLLTLAIVLEILGLTALKESDGFTRWLPATFFVVGLSLSFYLESLALRVLPIGMTYTLWAGSGIVGMCLVGIFIYGEQVGFKAMGGMAMIILGAALVLNDHLEPAAAAHPG